MGATVPLSREEQRALGVIERGLRSDDPRFVTRVECWPARSRRRPACEALALACGIALLTIGLLGEDPTHIALAVAGFIGIVAWCSVAVASRRRGMKQPGRRRRLRWPDLGDTRDHPYLGGLQ
jgi:hypothetical protein